MSRHVDEGRRGVQQLVALMLLVVFACMAAYDLNCFVGSSVQTRGLALGQGVAAQPPYKQLAKPSSTSRNVQQPQQRRRHRRTTTLKAPFQALETALLKRQQEMYCDPESVAAFDSISPGAWKEEKDFPPGLVLKTAQALSMCARNEEALAMYEHLVLRTRGLAELRELSAAVPPSRDANLVSTAARLLLTQYFVLDDHQSFMRICGPGPAPPPPSPPLLRQQEQTQQQATSTTTGSQMHAPAIAHDPQLEANNSEHALVLSVIEGLVRRGFDQCEYVGAFFDVMARNFTRACDRFERLVRHPLASGGERPNSPTAPPSKEHQVIARHLAFAAMLEKQQAERSRLLLSGAKSCSASQDDGNEDRVGGENDDYYGEWQAPEPLPRDSEYRCNIPRVNVEDVTPERFQSEYLLLNRPVIIRNLSRALHWPAHDAWARQPLLEHFGDQLFRVNRGSLIAANKINNVQEAVHMTLREFVDKHMAWRDGSSSSSGGGTDHYHAPSDNTQHSAASDPAFDPMYILDKPGAALRTSGAFPDPFAPWFTPTAPRSGSIKGEEEEEGEEETVVSSALPPWKNHFTDEERAYQMLFYLGRTNRFVSSSNFPVAVLQVLLRCPLAALLLYFFVFGA